MMGDFREIAHAGGIEGMRRLGTDLNKKRRSLRSGSVRDHSSASQLSAAADPIEKFLCCKQ